MKKYISIRKLYRRLAEAKKLKMTIPEYIIWRRKQNV